MPSLPLLLTRSGERLRQDLVMCNDEKLLSGSSSEYVRSCKEFLASTVFREGTSWPSAILAPSNIQRRNNDNLAINVRAVGSVMAEMLLVLHFTPLDGAFGSSRGVIYSSEGMPRRS